MTKKMFLALCLSLLCGANALAQRQARPSPFAQQFGSLVVPQQRFDRVYVPRILPPPPRAMIFWTPPVVPQRGFAAPRRPLVTWTPSQQRSPAVSFIRPMPGYFPARPVARTSIHFTPVATAAARPKPVTLNVTANRLLVRCGNPGSWYCGALRKENNDKFAVKAVRGLWVYGNTQGAAAQKGVWVQRKGLEAKSLASVKGNPAPKIRDHDASRTYLKNNFAARLFGSNSDGEKVTLAARAGLYDNYDPKTKKFSGKVKTLDPARLNREVRVRWTTNDGNGAVVRYSGVDKKGKPTKLSQWGHVPCAKLLDTHGKPLHCK